MIQTLASMLLPAEISDFERKYLARVNRVALVFFAAHVPVFVLVAWINHTRPLLALALTAGVLVGPAVAKYTVPNPRAVSIIHGVAAMFMGGLLVHFGQGPMQIEMHFYFFALVAMCVVFANPMVIVAAAATVALHHLVVWLALPRSVFNYDASLAVVGVHAGFIVLESVAVCFISRSFFDNVIGLERIVKSRTAALDAKNRDMSLLLDNVRQGFLTIDAKGVLALERSAAVDKWFGPPPQGSSWFDYIARVSPDFSKQSAFAWEQVVEGFLPLELTLDQMPHRMAVDDRTFSVDYLPIGAAEPCEHYLVIVTDITSDVARERAESERTEVMALFERVLADRPGFETFLEEGSSILNVLARASAADLGLVKRLLHTLKGNASVFGLLSVAGHCHRLEDFIAEEGRMPPPASFQALADRWTRLSHDVETLLGKDAHTIQIDEAQYRGLLDVVRAGAPKDAILKRVRELKFESSYTRLTHVAEQARRIAGRLEKGEVDVHIEDNGLRLDAQRWASFWASFIHAVRNAIDHGIEPPAARLARGKSPNGRLDLRTMEDANGLSIEITDDGNGIDWDALRARAERAGLPTETQIDLCRSLFVDGMSTAAAVTEFSGRGVGMSALLHATRALGGDVLVDSVRGKGTRMRMVFPNYSAMLTLSPPAAA